MQSNNANRPTHRIYAVTKNGDRKFWQEVGAAWEHQDGEGFTLKLDYLPRNDADLVVPKSPPPGEEKRPAT
jgi:hypothetical protein